jgi:hypothetical protein
MIRQWFASVFILLTCAVPAWAADGPGAPSRGLVLPALYVSFAGLNAYDAASTIDAVKHGAVEANPLLSGMAARPAALWAVKGGVTAVSILASERLWRRGQKRQAVVLMAITNGIMAAVAANNASVRAGLK